MNGTDAADGTTDPADHLGRSDRTDPAARTERVDRTGSTGSTDRPGSGGGTADVRTVAAEAAGPELPFALAESGAPGAFDGAGGADVTGGTDGADATAGSDGPGEAAFRRTVLILHGGGGPATVAGLAGHLAKTMHTLTPTHPGWGGTPRPDWFRRIPDLAGPYLRLLKERGLDDVLVVGSSLGGWLAAEMALRDEDGLIGGLVLIDAVGVRVEGEPVRDFFALDARGVAEYSFHDSERFHVDPAGLPPAELALRGANMATMGAVAGAPYMHDPDLLDRLRGISLPTLLLWGESDGIVTPAYGAAYAAAFGDARLEVVPRAGHLPHIERPEATFALLDAYVAGRFPEPER